MKMKNLCMAITMMVAGLMPLMAQTTPLMAQTNALKAAQTTQEEPVIIVAPDTTIDKTAYTLEDQGITISVSNGSAYPAEHSRNNIDVTYFGVLAGSSMTISAATNIKGIAINGWIKKQFTASCDHGTMSDLSDDEQDVIGEPVLTISDINNPSVTISCDKQLRCFSIEVYFSENPEAPQEEATDTIRLTMVTAQALDYSEDTTYSAEGAYSYWLMLAPQDGYPQIWLDLYSAVKGDLSGEYSLYEYNIGDYTYIQLSQSELDYEYAYDQAFTISKEGENYHIKGYIIAENDIQYEFVYDGPIELVKDDEQGVEKVQSDQVQSTKYIQNGMLLIERNGQVFNVLGTRL